MVFTIHHVLTGDHVYDMGQGTTLTLFTLMYILPAALGVALAVSGPKLLKHWE